MLVVDDCEVVAAAVSRILERAGFAVWVAYSCDEARGLAAGGSFVVGVLDVQLGDGDGLQLARWLQEQGSVGEIVFHSGSPLTDQERASVGKLGTVVAKGASSKVLLGAVVEAARIELGRQLTALEQLQRSSEPPSIQRSGRAAPRTPPQRPARRARRAPRP
ncbi:MAG: response regulator [Polyangiaceae bacterium]|nr:response regulator [Polyangiaceae bacterium]